MANTNSKRAQLIKLVSRKSGASISTLEDKLAWQPHTIRAEVSRLRKTGLIIACRPSSSGPVYQAQSSEKH